jgi:hypothetical protein
MNGQFESAAEYLRKIGEYFEDEGGDDLAVDYYKDSAELFSLAKYHVTDS